MNKVQKENSTSSLKTTKNKNIFKKNSKDNLNNYLALNYTNKKENKKKEEEKMNFNYQKRKNNPEKIGNLEKRNISPLLIKFRNFYSLLYKYKHKSFGFEKNKKNGKMSINNYVKKNAKNEDNSINNFGFLCMNINRINFPLNFNDINFNKNGKNNSVLQEKNCDKKVYLKTTNGFKSSNNSFFYSSRKELKDNINNNSNNKQNNQPKYNSNYFYENIIKNFQSLINKQEIININQDNNQLNLPSINSKRKNININIIDYQKITPFKQNKKIIRKMNKNNTFFNNSNNIIEMNSYNHHNKNIFIEDNDSCENNRNNNNIIPISNKNNCNNININNTKKDLKLRNKTKIYSIKKNFDIYYLYDLPPVNFYKEDFYYYNIFQSNCGWLIKNCFKHRLKWKECHCNNTNLYNFKWKEALNNNDFFSLSLNKTQIINHFEFQSCITNKYKMFYNFSKYCEKNNIDVFKYLPFTIILDISNFPQFLNNKENFKKMFNNINEYLFDTNSINNKTFDRRKLPYKLLYPNNDSKFGIKLYCEIPKSHYNGKNLWIVKAPNLNRGRCVKVFNNYKDIFSYIKKITEGKANEYDIDEIKKDDNNNKDINIDNHNKIEENISSDIIINKNESQEEKEFKYQSSIIIIQKYIERPFLYKKRKCDIRIWALLTHKMESYIFREGHLKASSVDYTADNFDSFVHLTNYSLQKYNKSFSKFEKGNEISFKAFQEFIDSQENNFNFYEEIFPKFIEIIKHTMLSVKNKINLNNRNYCFEIFGYDFIMDEDKNVYLIEINTNPGLEISSELIEQLVPRMIDDALLLTVDDVFPTEYEKECINENKKYKSKYHVNGYSDEENMWHFICDMKKNIEKKFFNSFTFKNLKRFKKRIKIKKFKNKK